MEEAEDIDVKRVMDAIDELIEPRFRTRRQAFDFLCDVVEGCRERAVEIADQIGARGE